MQLTSSTIISLKRLSSDLIILCSKGTFRLECPFFINGFTQCHACVVQTTTRYAGVHKKLYKKITNRITIRMFKSIVKKKGDFNGK